MINEIRSSVECLQKHNNTQHLMKSQIIGTTAKQVYLLNDSKIQFLERRPVIISNCDVHLYVPQVNRTDIKNEFISAQSLRHIYLID